MNIKKYVKKYDFGVDIGAVLCYVLTHMAQTAKISTGVHEHSDAVLNAPRAGCAIQRGAFLIVAATERRRRGC